MGSGLREAAPTLAEYLPEPPNTQPTPSAFSRAENSPGLQLVQPSHSSLSKQFPAESQGMSSFHPGIVGPWIQHGNLFWVIRLFPHPPHSLT